MSLWLMGLHGQYGESAAGEQYAAKYTCSGNYTEYVR